MSKAYQYTGPRVWIDGVPFGSWVETGDCYCADYRLHEGDVDLLEEYEKLCEVKQYVAELLADIPTTPSTYLDGQRDALVMVLEITKDADKDPG